jgi:hypothetical protein
MGLEIPGLSGQALRAAVDIDLVRDELQVSDDRQELIGSRVMTPGASFRQAVAGATVAARVSGQYGSRQTLSD